MKLGSIATMLAGTALALVMTSGVALAHPSPRADSASQKTEQGKKPALYPNATRKSPDVSPVSKKVADQLNEGIKAANAGNTAQATKLLEPYASGKSTDNDYVKGIALQALANLAYKQGNIKGAIVKLQQSLQTNALPNDTHFQLMYELVQFYYSDNQYDKALTTLKKWRSEGRRETADSYGLEGVIDYQQKNYKAAIAAIQKAKTLTKTPKQSWNQVLAASYAETGQSGQGIAMAKKQLAADPSDTTTRHNLISLLMSANKYPEALAAMEKARGLSQLTSSDDYINLAKLYLIVGQNSGKDTKPYAEKALAALSEGSGKGLVKSDYSYYKLEGDASLLAGNTHKALVAYTKAATTGTDGAAELKMGELLANAGKYHSASKAARKAIAKGTKHQGRAYMIIADAANHAKNKTAAVKAMRKAAKDPETRTQAKAWLHKAGY